MVHMAHDGDHRGAVDKPLLSVRQCDLRGFGLGFRLGRLNYRSAET